MEDSIKEELKKNLDRLMTERENRHEIIELFDKDTILFEEALNTAVMNIYPDGWNAAWVIDHCSRKNDLRIRDHIGSIVQSIPRLKIDGHQRQLLKILLKMEIEEEWQGPLFDICMNIWEALGKNPSLRITAFEMIIKIALQYPELKNEIEFITEDQYTESLSPGIRRSFQRMLSKLG